MKVVNLKFEDIKIQDMSRVDRRTAAIRISDTLEDVIERRRNRFHQRKAQSIRDKLDKLVYGAAVLFSVGLMSLTFGSFVGPAVAGIGAATAGILKLEEMALAGRVAYTDTVKKERTTYNFAEMQDILTEIDRKNGVLDDMEKSSNEVTSGFIPNDLTGVVFYSSSKKSTRR